MIKQQGYIDPEQFIKLLEQRVATIKADEKYDPRDAEVGAAILGMEQRLEQAKAAQKRRKNGHKSDS